MATVGARTRARVIVIVIVIVSIIITYHPTDHVTKTVTQGDPRDRFSLRHHASPLKNLTKQPATVFQIIIVVYNKIKYTN